MNANRKVVISRCDHCPHFDNVYWGYHETCLLLKRKIEKDDLSRYQIPEDCPLDETDEKVSGPTLD